MDSHGTRNVQTLVQLTVVRLACLAGTYTGLNYANQLGSYRSFYLATYITHDTDIIVTWYGPILRMY